MNRQERRKFATRQKLKDATLALVLKKGYDDVTIQEVVDLADLGRGTFYVHYQDMQAILWDIIQDGLQEAMHEGTRRSSSSNTPPGYMGYLITFETAAKHKDLFRVMLGGKGSALVTQRVTDYLALEIRKGIETQGFMREFDYPSEILAQFAIGALMRMVLWWLETPNTYTTKEMADMVFNLIHNQEQVSNSNVQ